MRPVQIEGIPARGYRRTDTTAAATWSAGLHLLVPEPGLRRAGRFPPTPSGAPRKTIPPTHRRWPGPSRLGLAPGPLAGLALPTRATRQLDPNLCRSRSGFRKFVATIWEQVVEAHQQLADDL